MFFGYAGSLLGYTGSALLCGLSRVVASRGYSLVAVHRLLLAVVSLVGAQTLGCVGFTSLAHGLSSCGAWQVASFKTRDGWNPCPLHWQVDSFNNWVTVHPLWYNIWFLAICFHRTKEVNLIDFSFSQSSVEKWWVLEVHHIQEVKG